MQHKVELSTLLRIVIARKKSRSFRLSEKNTQNLIKALAVEAIESLKNCDCCEADGKTESCMQKDNLWFSNQSKFFNEADC
jgi:hypothetical protein